MEEVTANAHPDTFRAIGTRMIDGEPIPDPGSVTCRLERMRLFREPDDRADPKCLVATLLPVQLLHRLAPQRRYRLLPASTWLAISFSATVLARGDRGLGCGVEDTSTARSMALAESGSASVSARPSTLGMTLGDCGNDIATPRMKNSARGLQAQSCLLM